MGDNENGRKMNINNIFERLDRSLKIKFLLNLKNDELKNAISKSAPVLLKDNIQKQVLQELCFLFSDEGLCKVFSYLEESSKLGLLDMAENDLDQLVSLDSKVTVECMIKALSLFAEQEKRIILNEKNNKKHPTMFCLVDENNNICYINDAQIDMFLVEKGKNNLLGKSLINVCSGLPISLPDEKKIDLMSFAQKSCEDNKYVVNSREPTITMDCINNLWFKTTRLPMAFDNKKYVLTYSVDVTELEETILKLDQANSDKNKLFSIIAHDLKTPFNSILGFSDILIEVLEDENIDINNIKNQVSNINKSAKKAYSILEHLLHRARAHSGNMEYKPKEVNLRQTILSSISLLEKSAEIKKIKLNSDISKDYFVFADKNMLEIILNNLIMNAIKYSPVNGGEVNLSLIEEDQMIKVFVSDNGLGIDEKVKNNIFNLDVSTDEFNSHGTAGEKGTGLGLSVCKNFVEKNGGTIGVNSNLGMGSIFWFTLPKTKTS